jgi:hypothetical protein
VTHGRVLSTKRYEDMPLGHDGENYPIKNYCVPILPHVAKRQVQTTASISRLTANEATFPNLLKGKP